MNTLERKGVVYEEVLAPDPTSCAGCELEDTGSACGVGRFCSEHTIFIKYVKPDFKRYMVFSYFNHDCIGGLGDCQNSFDSLEEVKKHMKLVYMCDHVEIFDRVAGIEIDLEEEN